MFSKPLTLYEAGGFSYMQSWRGWYSIGPENRHSERALRASGTCPAPTEPTGETSGFDLRSTPVGAKRTSTGRPAPQALRSAPLAQLVEHLTFNQRVGSSSLLRGTVMHEWRKWYTHLT